MKLVCHTFLGSVAILVGLMMIHGSEGHVGAYPENLFTTGTRGRLEATWSRPQPTEEFFEGQRWHFGFPCWAFYLDVSTQTGAWYALLDFERLFANWLVALVVALIAVLLVGRLKPNNSRS
jgi:hypothetical protein